MAGLPRLSREEELALCEDVQRWQRLERLREEIAGPSSAMDGDGGGRGRVGLEEWASAAGISVAVRWKTEGAERGTQEDSGRERERERMREREKLRQVEFNDGSTSS